MSVGRFTTVDDAADTSWYINFMDSANALPEYGEIRRLLIENLGPLTGRRVLDVGCGTGDDTRELAQLGATVTGTDLSEAMLAEARRRSTLPVEFRIEDVQRLSFPDDSFDATRVKLVRQHCPDLDAADDELVRVTRPGGRIAVFDFDFETLALDHPDRRTTREIVRHWADGHRQGWSGRQLRRRFAERGLTDLTITPCTVQFPFEFFRATMTGMVDLPVDLEAWWRPLEEVAAQDRFFAALTGFVLSGTTGP